MRESSKQSQGCPLASHLFNLALHAIDERVMPNFDEVLKMGYCDDSYFTSESITALKACTDEIAARCRRYAGLTYCQRKYEALAPIRSAPEKMKTTLKGQRVSEGESEGE